MAASDMLIGHRAIRNTGGSVVPANEYHFVTHWRVPGSIDEIAAILGDGPGLKDWWPSVYLDVQEVEPGDERHVGRVIDLTTKGWLPYTLRWRFRVDAEPFPYG